MARPERATERWRFPEGYSTADFSEYVAWMMPDADVRLEGRDVVLTDPTEQVRKRLKKDGAQLIAPDWTG